MLELRYGDPRAATAPSPPTVFSNSFAAVWHLDDRLDTMEVAEATGGRPGAALGGLDTAHQVSAQLGGGVDFDGVDARIEFQNPFTGNVDHTISAWGNQRAAAGFDGIVIVGTPIMNQSRWFESHFTSGVSAGFFQNDWPNPGTLPNIQNTGWILLHWTYVGSTKQSRM